MAHSDKMSPLMEQYFGIKEHYPEAILFFQVGDFYELFFDDAVRVSSFLALTLTKRGKLHGQDIPLCGVPVHTVHHYLAKLVKGGFTVALCNQMTKPQPGVVVERAVTQLLTPATLTENAMLDAKSASYLVAIYPAERQWGLMFAEILTAAFFATTIRADIRSLFAEFTRFFPDEVLIPHGSQGDVIRRMVRQQGYYTTSLGYRTGSSLLEDEQLDEELHSWRLNRLHHDVNLRLQADHEAGHALGMMYQYLRKSHREVLEHVASFHFYQPDDFLMLDGATQKNLEIFGDHREGKIENSLFAVMDSAATAMGSRMIKKWLQRPLVSEVQINARLESVDLLRGRYDVCRQLSDDLALVGDIERVIGRIALRRAQLVDYRQLLKGLLVLPRIASALAGFQSSFFQRVQHHLLMFDDMAQYLVRTLYVDGVEPWMIRSGYSEQLDRYRDLVAHGDRALSELEADEIRTTGIGSLKVAYNNQQGYYIEITHTHKDKIPDDYVHIQTLVNRSRFTTARLQILEKELAVAALNVKDEEDRIFQELVHVVFSYITSLRQAVQMLAQLDALVSFAKNAYHHRYVRPQMQTERRLRIVGGRHPVVEQRQQERFVPNDTEFHDQQSLLIITGPNMGGKSTYLRQTALISIMAQVGSFVPASSAELPILDRVFTRIGSGDNLAEGKSTFLVEMEETALICREATERSLVILDEVGRGTATYDGISLAHAIIEHIYTSLRSFALFATHYHELTKLADFYPGIVNFHLRCRRHHDQLFFLHEIAAGSVQASFGLDVARLAQIPKSIIDRAHELLAVYSVEGLNNNKDVGATMISAPVIQQPLHPSYTELIALLKRIDPDAITPRQALDMIVHIKAHADNLGDVEGA